MILRGYVYSENLEMDTGITVIVPNKFGTGEKYQVAYVLHGLCSNSDSWVDNTMLPVYANSYNVVFIMPEAGRSFYTDMQYGFKYFSYVTDELPKICKSVFNISAKREDTAIMGCSMGGYGALKSALSKPEQYGYCCAFSSASLFLKEYLDDQRENGETESFRAIYGERLRNDIESCFGKELLWKPEYEILELAKQVSGKEIKPKIYTTCGTKDGLRQYNIRLNDEMQKLDFDFTYEEWPGKHTWIFFDESIRKALKLCFHK